MKVPMIKWMPFNKINPPFNLSFDTDYLILLKEDNYNNGATWHYSMDHARPFGSYIDNFWDTTNDWCEGQMVEVVAYAEFPYYVKEEDLIESED